MGSANLRIVSYNVRYFSHALRGLVSTVGPKRRVAAALLSLDPLPDVVCLQEVETQSLRSSLFSRSEKPEETQLQAFMGRIEEACAAANRPVPWEAFYFPAHAYRLGETPLYTTGLAILVNTRRLRIDRHNVSSPHKITFHHTEALRDAKQSRICAHMRLIDEQGRGFHVFNTHLSLPSWFSKDFWRKADKMGQGVNQLHEAKTLVDYVHKCAGDEPYVVCGDFNSPPASPVFNYLCDEAQLIDAQVAAGQVDPKSSRGFPTAGFMHLRMHLDHVFGHGVKWMDCAGTCRFGDAKSPFWGLSDHMPILAHFQLPEPAAGSPRDVLEAKQAAPAS